MTTRTETALSEEERLEKNRRRNRALRGRPRRPVDLEQWFWARVDASGDCWVWTGATNKGYGQMRADPNSWKTSDAHRFAYGLLVGLIPPDLTLDHLCRNTLCVNPDHLEPVTSAENTLRGFNRAALNARKTHCWRGHELTGSNILPVSAGQKPSRKCRACAQIRDRRRRAQRSDAA